MTKLLSANFLRLRKSNTFWGSLGVCVGLGVLAAIGEFRAQISMGVDLSVPEVVQYKALLEGQFFEYTAFIGILAAEFIALFLGTEYSDGAIRNKIAVGHSRLSIYFANLITGFVASLMCMAGYMASCLAVGAPLLGWFTKPAPLILTAIFGSVVTLAAFCAIFTFVAMNCSKKSTSVVICLLGVFAALIAATVIYSMLEEPEFITGYEMAIDGQIANSVPEPNPMYLTGLKREIYQFIYDLLPTGQSLQYTTLNFTNPLRLMGLSAAVAAVFSAAGAALFRKKDLK
ncbi:MAG: ABC transporter permease [Oscillospiraceae bacterium]|nr:ABC transporter permease [Oscillospiraceae bacterium]MDE7170792.1 ABC transporter permease [Oscillospiraceae bacterium]